MLLPPSYRPI